MRRNRNYSDAAYTPNAVSYQLANQTVQIFSGLAGKKIYLRNGQDFTSNGVTLEVNLRVADCYERLEGMLSHVLWRTSFTDLTALAKEWGKRIDKHGNVQGSEEVVGQLTRLLEEHRVLSLWSEVYEGSGKGLKARQVKRLDAKKGGILTELLGAMTQQPVAGDWSHLRPLFDEAVRMVEKKAFEASMVTSRWLLPKLIDAIVKEAKKPPPSDEQGMQGLPTPAPSDSGGEGDDDSQDTSNQADAPEGMQGQGDAKRPQRVRPPELGQIVAAAAF